MSIENPVFGSEEEKSKEIKDAQSFDELYRILEKIGEIKGGKKVYTSGDLIMGVKKIENVTQQTIPDFKEFDPMEIMHRESKYIQEITRAEGLRDKVSELLYKELMGIHEYVHRTLNQNKK